MANSPSPKRRIRALAGGGLIALMGAAIVGCGGGGSGTSATSDAGVAVRPSADANGPAIVLAPPTTTGAGSVISLSWQLGAKPATVSVWVRRAANEVFEPVAATITGTSATFARGPARRYDFPTAEVRVEACNAARKCVQSNIQPLTAALLGGVPKLRPDPVQAEGLFGFTQSISDDGRVLVVSSGFSYFPGNDELPERGTAFVFERTPDGAWTRTAALRRPDALNEFASAVNLSGDGRTLVASAVTDAGTVGGIDAPEVGGLGNDVQPQRGAVLVYVRDTEGGWSRQAFIKPKTTIDREQFGRRATLSHDGNALLVEAAGRAVLFRRDATTWREVQVFTAPPTAPDLYHEVGATLSGDGRTVAFNLLEFGGPAGPSPVVTLYREIECDGEALWQPAVTLRTEPGAAGSSLTLDHAGRTLAVGSLRADNLVGAVTVFRADAAGVWSPPVTLRPETAPSLDYMGARVRLSADGRVLATTARGYVQNIPGIFRNHAAGAEVSPTRLDDDSNLGGAVYLYELRADTGWTHVANVLANAPGDIVAQGLIGFSLSGDGQTLGIGGTIYGPAAIDSYAAVY